MSGRLPFSSRHIPELVEQKRCFVVDRQQLPQVSADLIYILERMMRFDAGQRVNIEQVLFETSRLMSNLSIPK